MLIVSYPFILGPSPKMSYLRLEHVFYYLTLILRNHVFYEIAAPSDIYFLLIVRNKRLLFKTLYQECCVMFSPLS